MTGVSQEPLTSPTAKVPAVPVTQLVPPTPVWIIVNASFMLKALLAASANHYIGIWSKKTPMGVQNANAMRRAQPVELESVGREMVTVPASCM